MYFQFSEWFKAGAFCSEAKSLQTRKFTIIKVPHKLCSFT